MFFIRRFHYTYIHTSVHTSTYSWQHHTVCVHTKHTYVHVQRVVRKLFVHTAHTCWLSQLLETFISWEQPIGFPTHRYGIILRSRCAWTHTHMHEYICVCVYIRTYIHMYTWICMWGKYSNVCVYTALHHEPLFCQFSSTFLLPLRAAIFSNCVTGNLLLEDSVHKCMYILPHITEYSVHRHEYQSNSIISFLLNP